MIQGDAENQPTEERPDRESSKKTVENQAYHQE